MAILRLACGAEAASLPSLIDRVRTALATPTLPTLRGDADFVSGGTPRVTTEVPAAVLVPIIPEAEPKLLLTTRTNTLRQHAGQVAFPGGRIDATDKGPIAAALREAQEEVGLDPQSVKVLGLSDFYHTGTGYRVRPVVGVVPVDPALSINAAEVANVFQVPLEYALDPANHKIRETFWRGQMRRYYAIEWGDHLIWGATAGMLVNLSGRVT